MDLALHFDPIAGVIIGREGDTRRLSDVQAAFADPAACARLLTQDDPLLYYVTQVEENEGPGQLHYGLGILMPGKVGDEYYMTKGHLHAWRPAAEVYVGLRGKGMMILEDERNGESIVVPLEANSTVYVPGHTAHRTVNVGTEPLVYWGILSSEAGHDYGTVSTRNFAKVIVEVDGQPVVMDRKAYLAARQGSR